MSFETFSPLYLVTQLLGSWEIRLELKKGNRVGIQKENVTFITLAVPFSSQLKIL